jgi:biotin carboxylase
VRFADEDVCIGPPRSAQSYLNIPAILSAAEITGADAITPDAAFCPKARGWRKCAAPPASRSSARSRKSAYFGDKARARDATLCWRELPLPDTGNRRLIQVGVLRFGHSHVIDGAPSC